jgi:hypothetical protein
MTQFPRDQREVPTGDFGVSEQRIGRHWPSNESCTISVVSPWDGSNFHFTTASWAASTKTGFPPITRVVLTLPLARTTASTRTMPRICIFFASSGYAGVIRETIFRSGAEVAVLWAEAKLVARTTSATTTNVTRLPMIPSPQWHFKLSRAVQYGQRTEDIGPWVLILCGLEPANFGRRSSSPELTRQAEGSR